MSNKMENTFEAKLSQPACVRWPGRDKNLQQLSNFSEKEIKDLHGMGPNGIKA